MSVSGYIHFEGRRPGWAAGLHAGGITPNQLLFVLSAFPFAIPLVGATDTQPTFTLFAALVTLLFLGLSFAGSVQVARRNFMIAVGLAAAGISWLCLSVLWNAPVTGNANRQVSFLMFLSAAMVGVLNGGIFTRRRVLGALAVYVVFTVLFFLTKGAVESVIIRSRSDDGLLQLFASGRGASTLSPEPSFFAFQVFTLFLFARFAVWGEMSRRDRQLMTLGSIGLLVASLGGYGMIYASMVALIGGVRYLAVLAVGGIVGLITLESSSFRVLNLLSSFVDAVSEGRLGIEDVSILVRLTSYSQYIETFKQNLVFGDAFVQYGGGGLVSLLAGLGLFGVLVLSMAFTAIVFGVPGLRLKLVLMVWLLVQTISGPIGLPFVGLMIGYLVSRAWTPALNGAGDVAGEDPR
jgi:hypothetical protein